MLRILTSHEVRAKGGTILWIFIIGAVNWGLVGFARFDLVAWIFGGQTASVSRVVYALVGLAGLWCITLLIRRIARGSAAE